MRYADTLNVYSKLREGFEEKEAKIIALAIEGALEEADEILLKEVATKEDIANLWKAIDAINLQMATKADMANLRTELKEDITILEAKMGVLEGKMGVLEANLKSYIANFKTEIIKWMFLFWIGQSAVVFGIVFSIVKFVK